MTVREFYELAVKIGCADKAFYYEDYDNFFQIERDNLHFCEKGTIIQSY